MELVLELELKLACTRARARPCAFCSCISAAPLNILPVLFNVSIRAALRSRSHLHFIKCALSSITAATTAYAHGERGLMKGGRETEREREGDRREGMLVG